MEKENSKIIEDSAPKQQASQPATPPADNKNELFEELQKSIIAKDKQIESLKNSSGTFRDDINRLNTSLEKAVRSYRSMVVKAHPDIPEELITGKSVEDIDVALEQAKKIVARVKKSLEQESIPENVPVGAPTRSQESASNLSPREKIQYAVGGNY